MLNTIFNLLYIICKDIFHVKDTKVDVEVDLNIYQSLHCLLAFWETQ